MTLEISSDEKLLQTGVEKLAYKDPESKVSLLSGFGGVTDLSENDDYGVVNHRIHDNDDLVVKLVHAKYSLHLSDVLLANGLFFGFTINSVFKLCSFFIVLLIQVTINTFLAEARQSSDICSRFIGAFSNIFADCLIFDQILTIPSKIIVQQFAVNLRIRFSNFQDIVLGRYDPKEICHQKDCNARKSRVLSELVVVSRNMLVLPQDIGGLWSRLDIDFLAQDLSVVIITSEAKTALVSNHVEALVSSEFSLKNDKC